MSKEICLKILSQDDVSTEYLKWMTDPEVVQYLESRWSSYTLEDLRAYVRAMNSSSCDVMFGIFSDSLGHVGNIKIGNINQIHRFGDLGLLIGAPSARGRGWGTEAIQLATDYAFEELNLNKLIAGIYSPNVPSFRAFIKAGYRQVGVLESHRFFKGRYVDEFLMEKKR